MQAYICEDSAYAAGLAEPKIRSLRLVIVTPVYNDWASFEQLLLDLDQKLVGQCANIAVVAVNDGSTLVPPEHLGKSFKTINTVRILDLAVNLGHQRAIAVGLAFASRLPVDCVIVMDCDGEDRPSDVLRLIEEFLQDPVRIHVVERGKRSESFGFRIGYLAYKLCFRLATGSNLNHGNFCLLPRSSLVAILHSSNTWNNLPASIVRSRLPYRAHRMDRGTRYEGRSKMNLISLLLHGLSAVSVYLDVLTIRLLIASAVALAALTIMLLVVIGIRIFSDLAIPGWASTTAGILAIVILQIGVLATNLLLNLLHNRAQNLAVPTAVDKLYVVANRTVYGATPEQVEFEPA